ncbi:MAG: thiamine phosphate synthase [Actinobacteria bacterium]|nr:thiamine phosphate synthase [Actinomycetota bacterium]
MPAQGSFVRPQPRRIGQLTLGRLHLITPPGLRAGQLEGLDAALGAGAPAVQVRLKGGTDRERLAIIRRVRARCRATGAMCLVNDRADLALAVGADGVHLGADDLPIEVARGVLGPAAIVGATCRSVADARRAEAAGASYVGAGPVFDSSTKAGLPEPMGVAGIAAIAAGVSLPVIAIGGVTVDGVGELLDAGAHGVAVVAAVFGEDDPGQATSLFLDALSAAETAGAR